MRDKYLDVASEQRKLWKIILIVTAAKKSITKINQNKKKSCGHAGIYCHLLSYEEPSANAGVNNSQTDVI